MLLAEHFHGRGFSFITYFQQAPQHYHEKISLLNNFLSAHLFLVCVRPGRANLVESIFWIELQLLYIYIYLCPIYDTCPTQVLKLSSTNGVGGEREQAKAGIRQGHPLWVGGPFETRKTAAFWNTIRGSIPNTKSSSISNTHAKCYRRIGLKTWFDSILRSAKAFLLCANTSIDGETYGGCKRWRRWKGWKDGKHGNCTKQWKPQGPKNKKPCKNEFVYAFQKE